MYCKINESLLSDDLIISITVPDKVTEKQQKKMFLLPQINMF